MGVVISGEYLGGKRLALVHEPSGTRITTAAPLDNNGDGSSFSPTDLCAASLPACICTVMAIVAERHALDLSGMRFRVEKEMSADPRRIGQLTVAVTLPASLGDEDRARLERAAHTCPVHHSLHPDLRQLIQFDYV